MFREDINRVEFKGVNINYGDKKLLSQCNFEFPMNSNTRLLFKRDVEKFFFLRCLSSVKGFSGGQFLINGEDILDFSFEEYLKFRKNIGFAFSIRGLLHNKTLLENVMLPLVYHKFMPEKEAKEWAEFLFEYFESTEFMHKRPSAVVASAQKVTLLIRAFVHRPQWMILDNPEVFLSRRLYANLLQLLSTFRKEHNLKHLFFSTGNEDLADCLAEATLKVERERINILKIRLRDFEGVV